MTSPARIAYQNLLENGTVVASSEAAGFPVENAYDWITSDFFKPAGTGTINIDLTLSSPASADYFAFFNQNLYSLSGTIKLQYHNGSGYVDCFAAVTPTDNSPRLVTFPAQTATLWRVVITCASVFSIACISFGTIMALEHGMYMNWTKPKLARATQTITSESDAGAFLGRSIIARGIKTTVELQHASDGWVDTTWAAFVRHAEKKPFFFLHDIVDHPDECAYLWTDGEIPPPRQTHFGYMGASIPVVGLVE